jgi:hypothetical protein
MILGPLLLCLFSISSKAQDDNLNSYVYMVRIPATTHHKTAIQTGFRLAGRKGIITALHGVADGTTFSAYNESGDVLNDLKIADIDYENDLALLRSGELEGRAAEGLQAVDRLTVIPNETLRVLGHPEGINLYIKTVGAGTPVLKKLHMLIPPDSAQLFDKRKSPSANITILNISSGNLGPGYSGAPILNSNDRVVGVVDGGLRGGALAISWAIPIPYVEWRDIASARTLVTELSNLNSSDLFFTEEDKGATADQYTYQISGYVNGIPISNLETKNHRELIRFQGKLRTFDLTIRQYTNGTYCDTIVIKVPNWNFPPGGSNDDAGEPRTYFSGGVQNAKNSPYLELFVNPGTMCGKWQSQ